MDRLPILQPLEILRPIEHWHFLHSLCSYSILLLPYPLGQVPHPISDFGSYLVQYHHFLNRLLYFHILRLALFSYHCQSLNQTLTHSPSSAFHFGACGSNLH
jgi:hypothetical protein